MPANSVEEALPLFGPRADSTHATLGRTSQILLSSNFKMIPELQITI